MLCGDVWCCVVHVCCAFPNILPLLHLHVDSVCRQRLFTTIVSVVSCPCRHPGLRLLPYTVGVAVPCTRSLHLYTHRVEFVPFVISNSKLSVKDQEPQKFQKALDYIGGRVSKEVTSEATHLVMTGLTVTPKVIDALCQGVPIVTLAWLQSICDRAKLTDPITEPGVGTLPPIKETLYTGNPEYFISDASRRKLFQRYEFLFMEESLYNKFKSVVEAASGTVTLYTHRATDGKEDTHLLPDKLVIAHKKVDRDAKENEWREYVYSDLVGSGARSIKYAEITKAIVSNAMQVCCNPKVDQTEVPSSQNHNINSQAPLTRVPTFGSTHAGSTSPSQTTPTRPNARSATAAHNTTPSESPFKAPKVPQKDATHKKQSPAGSSAYDKATASNSKSPPDTDSGSAFNRSTVSPAPQMPLGVSDKDSKDSTEFKVSKQNSKQNSKETFPASEMASKQNSKEASEMASKSQIINQKTKFRLWSVRLMRP